QGFQKAAGRFFLPVLAGAAAFGILIVTTARLKKRKQTVLAAVAAVSIAAGAPVQGGMTVDYSALNRLLQTYVKDGKVHYEGLRKENRTLQAFLDEAKTIHPEELNSRDAQMAFWINAYNAIVIKAVVDRYPIKSVMDVKGFFDKITYSVGGEMLTLNEIESKARAFKDPRVHFAVVCASSSCPILRAEAYVPERLDAQLTAQGHEFLANHERGLRLDEAAGVAHLSQICKWYATDFIGDGILTKLLGSDKILKALEPYMDDATRRKAQSLRHTSGGERPSSGARTWKIDYMPYDWTLNK